VKKAGALGLWGVASGRHTDTADVMRRIGAKRWLSRDATGREQILSDMIRLGSIARESGVDPGRL
jgi:hypothetical protein